MKRLLLFIALGSLFAGCDISDDQPDYSLTLLPVSHVTMPAAFAKDSITEIPVKYIRPSSCHFFDSFYYDRNGMDRTVAIYCAVANNTNCDPDNVTEVQVPLRFKPTELGTYHFKFLTGENPAGTFQYEEYYVVVDH